MLEKLKDLVKIVLAVKNWPIVLAALVLGGQAVVRFRRGRVAPVLTVSDWAPLMAHVNFFRHFPDASIEASTASIDWRGRRVVMDFGWLTPGELGEVFGDQSYGRYFGSDFSGKTILDVGAAFGDSVVWFGLSGAKKVIGIEPLPSFAELCRKNIALNNLGGSCEVIEAGVGALPLADLRQDSTFQTVFAGYSHLASEFDKKAVPIMTLADLAVRYDLKDAWLKVDCEGWEYDFLLGASKDLLRLFEKIVIEYHYGFEKLEAKLKEAGFAVSAEPPHDVSAPERSGEYRNMRVGMLSAARQ